MSRTATAPSPAASSIVLALWLAPPVLSNSFLVFPEAFALLATASAVRTAFGAADEPVVCGLLGSFALADAGACYAATGLLAEFESTGSGPRWMR